MTKGSFYERLADHGHEVIADEDFAHLYAEGKGRPSVPPSVMVRAMLCATHDRTSDAETSRRTRVDSDWKAAMGVDDWSEGIGATTFSLMQGPRWWPMTPMVPCSKRPWSGRWKRGYSKSR